MDPTLWDRSGLIRSLRSGSLDCIGVGLGGLNEPPGLFKRDVDRGSFTGDIDINVHVDVGILAV